MTSSIGQTRLVCTRGATGGTEKVLWGIGLVLPIVTTLLFVCFLWLRRFCTAVEIATYSCVVALLIVVAVSTLALLESKRYRRFAVATRILVLTNLWVVIWAQQLSAVLGLLKWGQTPTVDILIAYGRQTPTLLAAIGVSHVHVVAMAGVLISISFAVGAAQGLLLQTISTTLRERCSRWGGRVFVLGSAGSAISALSILFYYISQPFSANWREPIANLISPAPIILPAGGNVTQNIPERDLVESAAMRKLSTRSLPLVSPHIIIISVDALRSDHMSVYGYGRQTTPNLQRRLSAGQGTVLNGARATCAESLCGLLSLMAGRPGFDLPTTPITIAQVLTAAGYRTSAILSGDHTNFYGLKPRLGNFNFFSDGTNSADVGALNDDLDLLRRVESNLPDQPTSPQFIFVHLMSVHALGKRHREFQRWSPVTSPFRIRLSAPDQSEVDAVTNHYDNGVLQADFVIDRLMELFQRKGMRDALVYLTADHGEYLGERGRFEHAFALYEPVLRIPAIWFGPRSQLQRLASVVGVIRQEDYAPTVLDMLGVEAPSTWTGESLSRASRNERSLHAQAEWVALVDGPWKVVFNRLTGNMQVFDLSSDRSETNDVSAMQSEIKLGEWRRALAERGLLQPLR